MAKRAKYENNSNSGLHEQVNYIINYGLWPIVCRESTQQIYERIITTIKHDYIESSNVLYHDEMRLPKIVNVCNVIRLHIGSYRTQNVVVTND